MYCKRKSFERFYGGEIPMKKKIKVRLVFIECVHGFLLNNADRDGKIPRNQITTILGRGLHIKKVNHKQILKELETFGIITNSQKNFIEIKKP